MFFKSNGFYRLKSESGASGSVGIVIIYRYRSRLRLYLCSFLSKDIGFIGAKRKYVFVSLHLKIYL